MNEDQRAIKAVLAYHHRTKHHTNRYAASPGYLDWANQPEPFRTFAGAEKVDLPLLAQRLDVAYSDLHVPNAVSPLLLTRQSVGMLFELALGLSAWKQYKNSRWPLRCNPSSGNLHPTEGYAILPGMPGLRGGVYHYVSRDHILERRSVLGEWAEKRLAELLPPSSFLLGLSSIHWREAWKYGERAFRYCQHDVGHAIATVRYSAAVLGWSARLLGDVSDATLAALLGLTDRESFADVPEEAREHPDGLLLIAPPPKAMQVERSDAVDIQQLREVVLGGVWAGRANGLSTAYVPWAAIDDVAEATWQKDIVAGSRPVVVGGCDAQVWPAPMVVSPPANAVRLIKQRRSCLALDSITSIPAHAFYAILDRLLPRPGVPPWDAWPWPAHLHCAIFVHRVVGLPSGLYLLGRNPTVRAQLQPALRADFLWQHPEGCPDHLPLFRLAEGDFQGQAQSVSCHQEIAAAGAFSLGMMANFSESVRARGPSWYRKLFWESGILGQVLYLEAEAAGLRGTGIGCFFDDAFHDLLGLRGDRFQSLYHFTVGGPTDDTRLVTLAPYAHLESARLQNET